MIKRALTLALCLGLVPASVFAQAATPTSSFLDAAHLNAAIQQAAPSDWQREYDDAQQRRKAGMKKMLIGGAASVVGAGIYTTKGTNDLINNGDTSSFDFGILMSLVGGGVFSWGAIEYFDARGDIASLEVRRPAVTGSTIAISDNHSVIFTAGTRNSLHYRLSW